MAKRQLMNFFASMFCRSIGEKSCKSGVKISARESARDAQKISHHRQLIKSCNEM